MTVVLLFQYYITVLCRHLSPNPKYNTKIQSKIPNYTAAILRHFFYGDVPLVCINLCIFELLLQSELLRNLSSITVKKNLYIHYYDL